VIDWRLLERKLAGQLQLPLCGAKSTPLAGDDINLAFRLDCGSYRFFVKLNRADREPMFVAEREGLEALRSSQTIRVPEVHLTGNDGEHAYIVMEYIELGGAVDHDRLAQALAAMHGCVQSCFGFHCDNAIGSTPQVNRPTTDWVEFWREQRLEFQLELARRNGIAAKLIDRGSRLAGNLAQFFTTYRPQPSLLHGDLWSGNWGFDHVGNPVVYDPACYYGDHEADLAMMELFTSPGARFFARYHECFPIDAGYAERRDLYNLYHLLNHANLFGGGYASRAQQSIDRLLAELR
jgi:protein-ribulosamine 3-kinase